MSNERRQIKQAIEHEFVKGGVPITLTEIMLDRLADAVLAVIDKTRPRIRGIEASICMGRDTTEDDLLPETKAPAQVIERLARHLPYNLPLYGENKALDRLARQIVAAEAVGDGTVERFCAWAKANGRDPGWYYRKPDTLWGDWRQAFPLAKREQPKYWTDPDEGKYVPAPERK